MRDVIILAGHFYHVYNQSLEKRDLFLNNDDRSRFLLYLLLFQANIPIVHLSRIFQKFKKQTPLNVFEATPQNLIKDILKNRIVELNSFSLMKNHFHLLIKSLTDDGVSKYLQRVCDGFAKYFNTRYNRRGYLFSSRFHARHINNDKYLTHVSAYLHSNISEVKLWEGREEEYPWSSYQDYLGKNRWGDLLKTETIMERFKDVDDYRKFVKERRDFTREAKLLKKELKFDENFRDLKDI